MLTFGVPDPGVLDVVGGIPVDFMPFGAQLEEPPGTLTPPPRKEGWTVAGFQDVHRHAQDVDVGPREVTVRMPSPAGYTALKLRSWAVRAAPSRHQGRPGSSGGVPLVHGIRSGPH